MAWNWHGKEQPISNAYDLPSLEECREAFEEHVGRKINWPEQIDDPEHLSPSDIWSRIKNIRSNLMDDYKKLALVKRWRTGEKEELEAEIAESEEHIEMLKRGLDDGTSY